MSAQQALAYLDERDAQVQAHPGAAFAERALLRGMLENVRPGNLLAQAYALDLERGVPTINNRAEARQWCHAVFFATDFGREPAPSMPWAADLLDQLLPQHVADADTLGELLIVARIIGHASAHVVAARAVFDAAWTQASRAEENFGAQYHLILVGGILYALD